VTGPVELEIVGRAARLKLNRPEAANTVSLALARAFHDAVARVAESEARVLIVSGEGRAFCAGGDIGEMHAAADLPALLRELAGSFHEGLRALRQLEATIIAEVDGAVAGAGLGLALHAELIIASSRSTFLTAYEAVDLTPDSGVSYLLPRAVGAARARAMSALGLRIDAQTAHEWGLVHEVQEPEALPGVVEDLTRDLSERPHTHLPGLRTLTLGDGLDEALDAELRAICEVAERGTARERVRAFVER